MAEFSAFHNDGKIYLKRREWDGVDKPFTHVHPIHESDADRLIKELKHSMIHQADYLEHQEERELEQLIAQRDGLNEEIARRTK